MIGPAPPALTDLVRGWHRSAEVALRRGTARVGGVAGSVRVVVGVDVVA
jgi:hypothetical protein